MNKVFYPIAVVALLICSCSTEKVQEQEVEIQVPVVEKEELVLTAYSSDGSRTKSSMGADGTFYWSPGDNISLFYGNGENGGARFESRHSAKEEATSFYGTLDIPEGTSDQFWGIYPYNEKNACFDGKLITEIPSLQTAAEGTFSDGQFISIGRSDNLSMGFYHLCGLIKFQVAHEGITRITLKGNNREALAGLVEVTLDNENIPSVSSVIEPKYEVVLTPPTSTFSTGVDYYFVTKPVIFEKGFTVTFEQTGTSTTMAGVRKITPSTPMEVHRAQFQWSNSPIDTEVTFFEVASFNVENEYVKNYLGSSVVADYENDPNYTISFFDSNSHGDHDIPSPFAITGAPSNATKVQVSTSPSFSEVFQEFSVSSRKANIYNLIPGAIFFYRILSSSNTTLGQGCIRPTGQVRMIEGVSENLRDLGGWEAENGKRIRYGVLYRGGSINDLQYSTTSAQKKKSVFLGTMRVGLDIDLRGYAGSSSEGASEPLPNDIAYHNFPVRKLLGFGTDEGPYTNGAILDQDLYRDAIKEIITFLNNNDKAVYFHCSAGADRTGTLAFLIEALLGVREWDLSKDYELTCYGGNYLRQRNFSLDNSNHLSDNNVKYPFKDFIMYLREYDGNDIQEKVTNWAKGGTRPMTDGEIAQLKALLLE